MAVVAGVVGVVALGGSDDDEVAGSGEVFLEPISSEGPDPFTDTVAESSSSASDLRDLASSSTSTPEATDDTTAAGESADDGADDRAGGAAEADRRHRGSEPGLYGGTRRQAGCDREQLVAFLEASPDKAEAWASVAGIAPSEIAAFVADLTPVLLTRDTTVLNHGFRDGEATPRVSVLEAGTAVLVDDRGVPRVRCFCGNPLLPPPEEADATAVANPDAAWDEYEPTDVHVVESAAEPMGTFELVDTETGERFERPARTDGDSDRDVGASETDDLDGTDGTDESDESDESDDGAPSDAGAGGSGSAPVCTAEDSRIEFEPIRGERVEETIGDLDGDDAPDQLTTYAFETDGETHFVFRVHLASGFFDEVILDQADSIAPVRPLGTAAIGSGRPVAFVVESSGASTLNVSLWGLHDNRDDPCSLGRVTIPDHTVPVVFPIGGSAGSGAGLECRDVDGDGTAELVEHDVLRAEGETYDATLRAWTWPGAGALQFVGEETDTYERPEDDDRIGAAYSFDCPGVEEP